LVVDKEQTEFCTHIPASKNAWSKANGLFKGNSVKARADNQMLEQLKGRLIAIYQDLRIRGEHITPAIIRNTYLGVEEEQHTLKSLISYHAETNKNNLSKGTLKHYRVTKRYLSDFIKLKKRSDDIYLKNIDYRFITDFEAFLRSYQPKDLNERKLSHNSIMKHLSRLRTLINLAIKLNWMDNYPFKSFKLSYKAGNRTYLTQEELRRVMDKHFDLDRINLVRDLFIFSCYTGLAYSDVALLSKDTIVSGIDGNKWIHCNRKKTGNALKIPLLPKAEQLIQKYSNHPIASNRGKVFPVPSNQKLNAYLKEIATICKIKKDLTFHMARHTFATTVTLSNGVPIETVSKILGHNRIATTQIYARVLENKVSEDMLSLRKRLKLEM
jgi:site-specific recombinase XerD